VSFLSVISIDEYPAKKLEHGIFLDFKLMGLEKISRISYQEYQKLGTGKLVQRIENGADAGKGVVEEELNRFLVRGFMEIEIYTVDLEG